LFLLQYVEHHFQWINRTSRIEIDTRATMKTAALVLTYLALPTALFLPLPPIADAQSEHVSPMKTAETQAELERAAESGNAEAMYKLGLVADAKVDHVTAAEWYTKAVQVGHVKAMTHLGFLLANGRGVPTDDVRAAELYRKAAEAGDADAMSNLGLMYSAGRGVPKSEPDAVTWYRRAADAGSATAMFNLGSLAGQGKGLPKSDSEAVRWYQLAADRGNTAAMSNLGYALSHGKGITRDEAMAAVWYRKAAEAGSAEGMLNFALLSCKGKGVARNYEEGFLWATLARITGDASVAANADKILERLADKIEPAMQAELRKRAREWLARLDATAVPEK
jgi:TPR repeat protein